MTVAARPRLALAVLCTAVFMASLDMFIVNVALDHIRADLGDAPLSDLSWVLSAYTIIYGALLVPAGRLADRFGRRSAFIFGLALFTLASVACGAAPGLWSLVAFRCVQAAGAAVLTPSSLGLLLVTTPEAARTRSVRIWASSGAIAGAIGPVVGGLLVPLSWRWIFLLNLPIGVAAIALALRCIPDVAPRREQRWPDLGGGAVLIVAIGALALALVEGSAWGWASPQTLGCATIAVGGGALFAYRSMHHPSPIVDPAMMRSRVFLWANVTCFLLAIAFAIELLAPVLFMQERWGWSALRTGLAIAPGPLVVPIFAMVGQRLARVLAPGTITALGGALLAAGPLMLLALVSTSTSPSYLAFLPGWLVAGMGSGLAFPTAIAAATTALPAHQASTGSAVVNMARQLGTVIGTSILVIILTHGDFALVWGAAAIIAALGATTALAIVKSPSETPLQIPAHVPVLD